VNRATRLAALAEHLGLLQPLALVVGATFG
jgi:hypothetical protein